MDRTRQSFAFWQIFVLVLGCGLLATWPAGSLASEQNAGLPGDWLSHFRSARAVGLGGAFVAVADEPTGMIWNPAGPARLDRNEVFLESARMFEESSFNVLSFTVPGQRYPTLGLSVLSLRSGEFERTDEVNVTQGSFREKNMAFLFSAAHNLLPQLAVGASAKVVRQSILDFNDVGAGIDVGVLAHLNNGLRLGASYLNLGGPSVMLRETKETYAEEFRGGAALEILAGRGLLAAEIDHVLDTETTFHAGGEFWLNRHVALRMGFNASSPTGGFSWLLPHDARLDYGLDTHKLGVTHRFGVSFRFGGFYARSQAEPGEFSPFGHQGATKILLSSRARKDIRRWQLTFTDRNQAPVRTFGGQGEPPAHVMWDGKSDTGKPLADGVYLFRLVVIDRDGWEVSGPAGTVRINTSVPEMSVPVTISQGQ